MKSYFVGGVGQFTVWGCLILIILMTVPVHANDFYVRPLGEAIGGSGDSYEGAWDGLCNIQWGIGEDRVGPGDRLYICGEHHDQALVINESGSDDSTRIIIDGRCPEQANLNDTDINDYCINNPGSCHEGLINGSKRDIEWKRLGPDLYPSLTGTDRANKWRTTDMFYAEQYDYSDACNPDVTDGGRGPGWLIFGQEDPANVRMTIDKIPDGTGGYLYVKRSSNNIVPDIIANHLKYEGDAVWDPDNLYIITYSSGKPGETSIPGKYAGIYAENLEYIDIRHLEIKNMSGHGIRMDGVNEFHVYNVKVSFVGGGVSVAGSDDHARAGNGITITGNSHDTDVWSCDISQAFDPGLDVEIYKVSHTGAYDIVFSNNTVDKCGGAVSVGAHNSYNFSVHDIHITGNTFSNLGYGWSGPKSPGYDAYMALNPSSDREPYDNSDHGRGVGIREVNPIDSNDENYNPSNPIERVYDIFIEDNIIDNFTWAGIIMFDGDAVIKGNIISNGNAEYEDPGDAKAAGIIVHGVDYGIRETGDYAGYSYYEATALITNNLILNHKGYGIYISHNTPKPSEGHVEIYNNTFHNDDTFGGTDKAIYYTKTSKGEIFKNNILYSIETPFFYDKKGGTSWTDNTISDNNIFYSKNANGEWTWGSTTYTSLSDFSDASDNDTSSNSLTDGPLFVDAGSGRFDIDQSNPQAPAVDTAASVDLGANSAGFCGHTIPTGSGPDIGAFEGRCDLLVYLPLDEGPGSTVNDASGNENDPTVSGSPLWVDAHIGTHALDFDGSSDYLSVEDVPLYDDNGFTISSWVKPDGTQNDYDPIVFHWSGGIRFIPNTTQVQFTLYNASNQYTALASTASLSDGAWSLVTAVYDDVTDKMHIYINGQLDSTLSNVGGLSATHFDGTKSFSDIGGNSGGSRMFKGSLDDIRIYNIAYSGDDVQELYESDSIKSSIVVHLPLNEGNLNAVNDLSGYENNAVVTGNPDVINGKVGGHALDFDGSSDYLSVEDVPLYDDNGFTISSWVKPDGTQNDYDPIVFHWSGGIRFIPNTTQVQFTLYNASNQYTALASTASLSDGAWSLVTAVYDDVTDKMHIYINGQLDSTLSNVGGLSATHFDGTKSFSDIGGNSGGSRMFKGSLDDIRIYNTSYSDDDVQGLYGLE